MKMKTMNRDRKRLSLAVLFCALVVLCLAGSSWGADVSGTRVLTLEDCLRIAEDHHPDLEGADAQNAIERARLSQAAVGDRVEVSGSVSATRSGAEFGDGSSYSVGVSSGVKVYDANRSKYAIDSQRRSLSATEATGERTLSLVRASVKTSYMDLLLNLAARDQRKESVDAFRRHLEQARGFYEVGSKPRFDVTKAEVDLGRAELALVEAESSIEISRVALLNAMGVAEIEPFEVALTPWDIPVEMEREAEALALEHRPDYRAAAFRTLAGKASMSAEARYGSPSVSLRGGYSYSGDDLSDLDKGWNVGLSMSIPIVDGGAAKARLAVAEGQVRSLSASQESLRQDILLEVRRAALDVKNARERIRITELTVGQAEENYALAEGRYDAGVGSALEITDALLALTDARLSAFQARYGLQTALVGLERATGLEMSRGEI